MRRKLSSREERRSLRRFRHSCRRLPLISDIRISIYEPETIMRESMSLDDFLKHCLDHQDTILVVEPYTNKVKTLRQTRDKLMEILELWHGRFVSAEQSKPFIDEMDLFHPGPAAVRFPSGVRQPVNEIPKSDGFST